MQKPKYRIFFCFLLFILLFGCDAKSTKTNDIVVFAAASLTESFTLIANEYEKISGIKVILNFAGSQTLKTSIEAGTKADIFASANLKYMKELKDKGTLNNYRLFLKNRLVLIKSIKSDFIIKDFKDLALKGIRIAVGDETVPVGSYFQKAFSKAVDSGYITSYEREQIEKNIKTKELNVKDVVSKVILSEVDLGAVYRTDITPQIKDQIEEISFPVFEEFEAEYPIAVLKEAEDRVDVEEFFKYILSVEAMEVFRQCGFMTE